MFFSPINQILRRVGCVTFNTPSPSSADVSLAKLPPTTRNSGEREVMASRGDSVRQSRATMCTGAASRSLIAKSICGDEVTTQCATAHKLHPVCAHKVTKPNSYQPLLPWPCFTCIRHYFGSQRDEDTITDCFDLKQPQRMELCNVLADRPFTDTVLRNDNFMTTYSFNCMTSLCKLLFTYDEI